MNLMNNLLSKYHTDAFKTYVTGEAAKPAFVNANQDPTNEKVRTIFLRSIDAKVSPGVLGYFEWPFAQLVARFIFWYQSNKYVEVFKEALTKEGQGPAPRAVPEGLGVGGGGAAVDQVQGRAEELPAQDVIPVAINAPPIRTREELGELIATAKTHIEDITQKLKDELEKTVDLNNKIAELDTQNDSLQQNINQFEQTFCFFNEIEIPQAKIIIEKAKPDTFDAWKYSTKNLSNELAVACRGQVLAVNENPAPVLTKEELEELFEGVEIRCSGLRDTMRKKHLEAMNAFHRYQDLSNQHKESISQQGQNKTALEQVQNEYRNLSTQLTTKQQELTALEEELRQLPPLVENPQIQAPQERDEVRVEPLVAVAVEPVVVGLSEKGIADAQQAIGSLFDLFYKGDLLLGTSKNIWTKGLELTTLGLQKPRIDEQSQALGAVAGFCERVYALASTDDLRTRFTAILNHPSDLVKNPSRRENLKVFSDYFRSKDVNLDKQRKLDLEKVLITRLGRNQERFDALVATAMETADDQEGALSFNNWMPVLNYLVYGDNQVSYLK